MLNIAVIAAVFGLIFVGELPDKTAVAGFLLGSRYPWRWVFAGTAAAFLTHVVIAVAAGSVLTLLPHRALQAVVAVLFLLGAVLIWREGIAADDTQDVGPTEAAGPAGFWKTASLGYVVIFVGEWGDLTQILTANLAAKYHDPLSVGIGAVLGLWTVGLLSILSGRTLLNLVPIKWITRGAALVMVLLSVVSIIEIIRG